MASNRDEDGLALEHWKAGEYNLTARVLFKSLAAKDRPRFLASILAQVVSPSKFDAFIEEAMQLTQHPDQWERAAPLFQEIRRVRLDQNPNPYEDGLLGAAEKLMKTTYNLHRREVIFDEHADHYFFGDLFKLLKDEPAERLLELVANARAQRATPD